MAWLLPWLLGLALARDPTPDECASVERAVERLWLARSVAEAVARRWPGWRPTLVGTRYHTREGLRVRIGRGEIGACKDLPVPARIVGRGRTPRRPHVGLAREGEAYWLEVAEHRPGMPLEELSAAVVHQLFHVHQFRSGVRYRDVRGTPGMPDPAWAYRQVATAPSDVTQMLDITERLLTEPQDASTLQRLVAARRKHFDALAQAHPRLADRVALEEWVEGTASWVELQVVEDPVPRRLLLEAGVPPFRLKPDDWRAALLEPEEDYAPVTGVGVALILDRSGIAWKAEVAEVGFDRLLERAVADRVKRSGNR